MNAKHTPGPWTVLRSYSVGHPAGGLVADVYAPTGERIDRPTVDGQSAYHEARTANARLIAAAPDLLRALMAIVENADKGFSVTTWTGLDGIADAGTVANVDAARAAIARATGGVK